MKLTFDQLYKEVDKLKRRATKLNKISGNVQVVVMTRLKPRKYEKMQRV